MTVVHSNFARARRAFAGAAIALLALGTSTAWAAPSSDALKNALGRRTLKTIDGKTVTWAALEGEVVVVNFWATWCKPCRKELPRLDALDKELAKSGGRVLAVSVDLDRENVRRFAEANDLDLAICHDGPDGLAKDVSLEMLPYTVVLDRRGTTAYASAGSDDEALDALVAKVRMLAQAPRVAVTDEVMR